jgi:hypothetical protein
VSQRHKPSAQSLLEGLSPADRQETLLWLVQAFDVMHFTDSLLFDTALLLDRYYACQPREDSRGGQSQRKLLAAVCMALKMGSPVDTQLPLRQVVNHLCREQVPFDEVLGAELMMLRKLRFNVGTPTARDFLEAFSTRLSGDHISPTCWSLAEFLLQLTLGDANLHYRYAHAVLAGASLAVAMYSTRATTSAYLALLEDLALHCPDAALPHGTLEQCCVALHTFWLRCVVGQDHQNMYAKQLCLKFSRDNHHRVSKLQPPPLPPGSFLPLQGWVTPFSSGCCREAADRQRQDGGMDKVPKCCGVATSSSPLEVEATTSSRKPPRNANCVVEEVHASMENRRRRTASHGCGQRSSGGPRASHLAIRTP